MIFTAHFLSAPEISHDHEHMTFTAHFPWIPEMYSHVLYIFKIKDTPHISILYNSNPQ